MFSYITGRWPKLACIHRMAGPWWLVFSGNTGRLAQAGLCSVVLQDGLPKAGLCSVVLCRTACPGWLEFSSIAGRLA